MVQRSSLWSLGLLILLLLPYAFVGTMTTQPLKQTEEFTPSQTGWLGGWQYRKSHTITGSVGAGTNYQIRITVYRTTGSDSGGNVYVGTNCKSDFGDIRFTDDDGVAVLDYWMETSTATEAVFWIKISDNLDFEQSVFVYYGNDAAVDESDGDDTFTFFDHFEGSSLDLTKWSIEYSDGTATVSNSILTLSGNDGDFRIAIMSIVSAFSPASIRFSGMLEATETTPQWNHIAWSHNVWGPGTYQRAGIRSTYGEHKTYVANDNGDIGDVTLGSQYFDTFHTFDVHRLTDSCELYSDDTFVTSGNNQPDATSVPIVMYCRDDDYTLQCDWLFMRKVIDTEPGHGTWGTEEQPSWLSGWQYRKSHTISGSVGAGTDYQIRITVHRETGTDSGKDVFIGNKCQTNFGDIRFTDNDGSTLLDYWLEEYDTTQATFWIEISDNLDNDVSIFVYYGNQEENSISDGEATFLFCDEFDGSQLDTTDRWTMGQGSISVSEGFLQMDGTDGTPNAAYLYTQDGWGANIIQELRVRSNTATPLAPRFASFIDTDYGWTDMINGRLDGGSNTFLSSVRNDDVWGSDTYNSVNDVTSWHVYSAYWISGEVGWAQDRGTTFSTLASNVPDNDEPLSVIFSSAVSVGDDLDIDWVFVRKYIASEPVHAAWGIESTSSITTTTTTSTNTGQDFLSSFIPILGFAGIVAVVLVGGLIYSQKKREGDSYPEPSRKTQPHPSDQPLTRVPREVAPKKMTTPVVAASTTPRLIERKSVPVQRGPVQVASGFDIAGENLKLAIKVTNSGNFIITDVQVVLNIPDAFEFERGTSRSQDLGNIPGESFESAIFWLRPLRCVDSEYSGSILYVDARGDQQVVKIPPKRLVNICPMLSSTERADEVFARLKSGALSRNCASFEFTGGARSVLKMAKSRLKGLTPIDHGEHDYEDGTYLGYSYYVGETKYGESQFAAEIQVSGTPSGGVLTLSIYADDDRILSGFFVDVMHDVREHIEIIKEKMCPVATCSKCGGNLDLTKVGEDRIYTCEYCGTMGKASPWME